MTHHADVLLATTRTLQERTTQYGSPAVTYKRAAAIASQMLQKDLTAYDVVMILHAVKLSRMPSGRDKIDHYEDAINYLAFAAEFANAKANTEAAPKLRVFHPQAAEGKLPPVDLDELERELTGEAV